MRGEVAALQHQHDRLSEQVGNLKSEHNALVEELTRNKVSAAIFGSPIYWDTHGGRDLQLGYQGKGFPGKFGVCNCTD